MDSRAGCLGLVVGALVSSGCVDVHRPPQTAANRHEMAGPAHRYEGPGLPRDISRGGAIFGEFCNPCHAGRVNPRGYRWSPEAMRRQIREGNAAMPGISDQYLNAGDLEAVLAFLTVISAVDAEFPPESSSAVLPGGTTASAAHHLAAPPAPR